MKLIRFIKDTKGNIIGGVYNDGTTIIFKK